MKFVYPHSSKTLKLLQCFASVSSHQNQIINCCLAPNTAGLAAFLSLCCHSAEKN